MPERQYEFRVLGRLSQTTRPAFVDMDLTEVPAETIISTTLVDDDEIHAILTLIQSLGLNVISVERVSSSEACGRTSTGAAAPTGQRRTGVRAVGPVRSRGGEIDGAASQLPSSKLDQLTASRH